MAFSPAVLDKMYQAVQFRKDQFGPLGRTLYGWGLQSGERHFNRGKIGSNRVFNGIIFKKFQALFGGKLKAVLTGSAPLSADVQKFMQTVLDVPIRQGYGLTETCANTSVAFWGDNAVHNVGPPTVSSVIRLADWSEGKYMNSDKDRPEIGMRRGEILVGGPAVSPGYFISESRPSADLQKKNEEDWVMVGNIRFFRSGDIGQIKADGTLEIIDRKKDLWKGPEGEYVAFAKVEAALKLCEFVDTPMCYGKTDGAYAVALICPRRERILSLAKELGLDGDLEELCNADKVVDYVTKACRLTCKDKQLVDFEVPKSIALIADPWTAENKCLTAALKLKRPIIAEKHRDVLDRLYS
jgi:long-subunit acyl-CoA synthetase (AMP-forming)